jgi:uncharacterized membrane protein
VHHRLLDLGFSHLKATSIILGVNVLIIILTLLLRNIGNMTLFMIIFCLASILSYIPVAMVNRNQRKAWSVKKAGDDLELSIEHRERSQEKKA